MERRLFVLVILLLSAMIMHAQDKELETRLRWTMNERLLDLADAYENASRFASSSDIYAFSSLFLDPSSATVYCDYFSSKDYGRPILLNDYINYSKSVNNCFVWVSNLRKSDFKYHEGHWYVMLEMDKRISYEDARGFAFRTSPELTGGDIHLGLECLWDEIEEQFKVNRIIGARKQRASLAKGEICLVDGKGLPKEAIFYNGEPLEFNDYGFTILPDDGVFSIDNDNFVLSVNSEQTDSRYNLVKFGLSPNNFRLRTRLSMMPAGAYSIGHLNELTIGVQNCSFAIDAGADIGYAFRISRATRIAAYTGLGISFSPLSLGVEDLQYTFRSYSYSIDSASYGVFLVDAVFPLFISFEQNISPRFSIVADIGAKWYQRISDYYGTYSLDGSVIREFAEDLEDSESVHFGGQLPSFFFPRNSIHYAYSFFLMVGADYAFASGKYAYLHLGWEHGITSRFIPEVVSNWYNNDVVKSEMPVYPLCYDDDMQLNAPLISLLDGIYKSQRVGFVAEFGIRFKFGGKVK